LIVICTVVYAAVQGRWELFSEGFVPVYFTESLIRPGRNTLVQVARCAAAFFMHGSLVHLLSNMWFLWIFGSAVEGRLGLFRFITVYMACGGLSMLAQAMYDPLSTVAIVGASGAIAGMMGIHFVLLPLSKILVWFPPVFFLKVPAFVFLLLWFYVQYASAGHTGNVRVAWWAHIGGFLAGIVWGVRLRISSGFSDGAKGARKRKDARR
jgi:membrane associated rhomboid family serine protease